MGHTTIYTSDFHWNSYYVFFIYIQFNHPDITGHPTVKKPKEKKQKRRKPKEKATRSPDRALTPVAPAHVITNKTVSAIYQDSHPSSATPISRLANTTHGELTSDPEITTSSSTSADHSTTSASYRTIINCHPIDQYMDSIGDSGQMTSLTSEAKKDQSPTTRIALEDGALLGKHKSSS